jgi:hypothetical protein
MILYFCFVETTCSHWISPTVVAGYVLYQRLKQDITSIGSLQIRKKCFAPEEIPQYKKRAVFSQQCVSKILCYGCDKVTESGNWDQTYYCVALIWVPK